MNNTAQLSPSDLAKMTESCEHLDTMIGKLQSKDLILGRKPKAFKYGGHNNKKQIALYMDVEGYKPGNFGDMINYNSSLKPEEKPLFLIALGTEIEDEKGKLVPHICNVEENTHVAFHRSHNHTEWNNEYHFIGVLK
jgi:hypothetical protein